MGKTSNKSSKYIMVAIVLIVVLLGYFFIPSSLNTYSNTYKLKSSGVSSDPIKLQFRSGFQHDHYKPSKKTTFMQKRMEENEEGKKPIFWKKSDN
ncbi:hypothetical protein Arnit_0868 [Arcobacter nitrofigilis DSM 7299]|uniref:Uncharacterized protein n=1 Tax=Arcobacter nitrofigilis (strain ATCC 33309 / DSM 7299 / CCUG 15893 / LMG 7604 / NCTC 12251 / CI) TaxID=572480 RepID=D5V2V0_ARCNC|nr:hypothetical protein [Arcobacter nitrofigilis]ADG92532.1 hypothetical protein Arnit_0868 [Arcobacter nitrofigilis DSM 7299]